MTFCWNCVPDNPDLALWLSMSPLIIGMVWCLIMIITIPYRQKHGGLDQ